MEFKNQAVYIKVCGEIILPQKIYAGLISFTGMDKLILMKAGLTKQEAEVYLTLLYLGPSTAGKITAKSGIHRRCVYDCTERLIKKGLVSYFRLNKKRLFEAAHPERLLQVLSEKEEQIRKSFGDIESILPQLISNYKFSAFKHEAGVFRGKEGLKTILEDILKTGKENLILGGESTAPKILANYLNKFHQRRIEKKIPEKFLFNSSEKGRGKEISKMDYTKVRFLPVPFDSSVTINIFGAKTAFITWLEEEPLGILIENGHIADGMRTYFDLIWKISKD
jgi:sugar-specific transcriptional regulator TrmB